MNELLSDRILIYRHIFLILFPISLEITYSHKTEQCRIKSWNFISRFHHLPSGNVQPVHINIHKDFQERKLLWLRNNNFRDAIRVYVKIQSISERVNFEHSSLFAFRDIEEEPQFAVEDHETIMIISVELSSKRLELNDFIFVPSQFFTVFEKNSKHLCATRKC